MSTNLIGCVMWSRTNKANVQLKNQSQKRENKKKITEKKKKKIVFSKTMK